MRKNGGQYTHVAIWATMTFTHPGVNQRTWELFDLINPVNNARSLEETDVYAVAPHTGRGGWTWYTGSAAWMYQLLVESLLGLKLEVNTLRISL